MGYPIGATGACMCARGTWQSLARLYQNGGTFEGKRPLSKEWVELVLSGNMSLQRWKTEGALQGRYERTDADLSPHGRVIAWQSYDPEGKGNTLMELILKNE